MRTLTVAALGVLLLAPEAIVHPSFQMSFAATLALVAGYQHGLPWMGRRATRRSAPRIALWGGREVAGLILASLVAGLATMPYAAYHFHRLAPYGVLANLLAMPIVSAWVMPTGILGADRHAVRLRRLFWRLMGEGIDWMIAVALWVASLPGAVGRMPAFGIGPLLLGTAGPGVLCLLAHAAALERRSAGRRCAVCWAVQRAAARRAGRRRRTGGGGARRRRPARGPVTAGSDAFAVEEWLAADGDARSAEGSRRWRKGIRCDAAGCIGRLADGRSSRCRWPRSRPSRRTARAPPSW